MVDKGLNDINEEGVAVWLGEKITVAGMEASKIMR